MALSHNLMGVEGKLGTIVKFLGQPIIDQSDGVSEVNGVFHSQTSLPDFDLIFDDEPKTIQDYVNNIPVMDEGNDDPEGPEWGEPKPRIKYRITQLGFYYYGLSQGIQLEIKYLHEESSILANYKGIKVYEEKLSELLSYIPQEEWEKHVDKLYLKALEKKNMFQKQLKQENKIELEKKKNSWLQSLRNRWGI